MTTSELNEIFFWMDIIISPLFLAGGLLLLCYAFTFGYRRGENIGLAYSFMGFGLYLTGILLVGMIVFLI